MSSHRVRAFVAKWDLPFAVFTVAVYTLMIPVLIFVFPDVSNLWVSLFVIIGTWTSAVSALATLLKDSTPAPPSQPKSRWQSGPRLGVDIPLPHHPHPTKSD